MKPSPCVLRHSRLRRTTGPGPRRTNLDSPARDDSLKTAMIFCPVKGDHHDRGNETKPVVSYRTARRYSHHYPVSGNGKNAGKPDGAGGPDSAGAVAY